MTTTPKNNTPTDNAWLDELLQQVHWGHNEEYQNARQTILTHIDTVCREARKNEAKINLAPLSVPNHMRSMRNSNTSRKRGAVMYFNKVAKNRLQSRLKELA